MRKSVLGDRRKLNIFYLFAMLLLACAVLSAGVCLAINHPTSNPYETRPTPDGFLPYLIIPTPAALAIET